MMSVLDKCVPDHRRDEVKEDMEQLSDGLSFDTALHIFSSFVGYAATLGMGFVLHHYCPN